MISTKFIGFSTVCPTARDVVFRLIMHDTHFPMNEVDEKELINISFYCLMFLPCIITTQFKCLFKKVFSPN